MKKLHPTNGGIWLCFFLFFTFPIFSFSTDLDDACYYNCKDGGEIGIEQTIVRGTAPALLRETKAPRCELGEREYLWMYYSASSGGWKEIPNSNTKNYQAHALFRTTYFLRCVRKKGCPTFIESNIIRVAVVDCMPSGIAHEEACLDDATKFYAKTVYSTNDVKYQWTFEGGSPSTSSSQNVDVIWSSEGLKKVTLSVIDGQCKNTYEEEVYVINCDCKGFYCRVSASADCGSGSARANGYGGAEPYRYRWSNGATSRRVSGLAVGSNSVTVTDANGCECVRYFDIASPAEIGCRIISLVNPQTCGGTGGSATVKGFGGSGRYSYSWSNGQRGAFASGLSAGEYLVQVRDVVSGCESVCNVNIQGPALSCVVLITDAICGLDNGTAEVTEIQGSGNYNYRWSNGSSSSNLTDLPRGDYEVTITDVTTGCTSTCMGTVGGPSPLNITDLSVSQPDCDATQTGSISVSAEGGIAPLNFGIVSNGVSFGNATSAVTPGSASFSGLQAGSYFVVVTDGSNCSIADSEMFEIESCCDDDFEVTLEIQQDGLGQDIICPIGSGVNGAAITLSLNGGDCNQDYTWTDGESSNRFISSGDNTSILGVPPGQPYCVTVTSRCDPNCSITQCLDIPESTISFIELNLEVTQATCEEGGAISIAPTGGVPPYFIRWGLGIFPDGTTSQTNVAPGEYIVLVSDGSGCSNDIRADIVIEEPEDCCDDDFEVLLELQKNCPVGTGVNGADIRISISNGDCNNAYTWNDGIRSGQEYGNSGSNYLGIMTDQNYCITVTSNCNPYCQVIECIDIPETTITLIESNLEVTQPTCNERGAFSLNPTGGVPPYSVRWGSGAFPDGTTTRTNLEPGTYTVTVSDASSCSSQQISEIVLLAPEDCCENNFDFTISNASCGSSESGAIRIELENEDPNCDYDVEIKEVGATEPFIIRSITGTIYEIPYETDLEVTVLSLCGWLECERITKNFNIGSFYEELISVELDIPCADPTATVTATASEGFGAPYNYIWTKIESDGSGTILSNGATNSLDLEPGEYQVRVDDGVGCTDTRNYTSFTVEPCVFRTASTDDLDKEKEISLSNIANARSGQTIHLLKGSNVFQRGKPFAQIFPNPFHESVNILLGDSNSHSRLLNIQVMNVAGQVVQQQVIDSAFAKYELDLLNQPSGIYFIRISGEGIEPEVHKVVKK